MPPAREFRPGQLIHEESFPPEDLLHLRPDPLQFLIEPLVFRVVSLRREVSRRTKEPLLQPLVIVEGLPQRVFHLCAATRRKAALWVELCLPSPHRSIGANEIEFDATSSP